MSAKMLRFIRLLNDFAIKKQCWYDIMDNIHGSRPLAQGYTHQEPAASEEAADKPGEVAASSVAGRKRQAPDTVIAARSVKKPRLSDKRVRSKAEGMAERFLENRGKRVSREAKDQLREAKTQLMSVFESVIRQDYRQAHQLAQNLERTLSSALSEDDLKKLRRACDYLANPDISEGYPHYKLAYIELFLIEQVFSLSDNQLPLVEARDELADLGKVWIMAPISNSQLSSVCLQLVNAAKYYHVELSWELPADFLQTHEFSAEKADIKKFRGDITRFLIKHGHSQEALLQAMAIVEHTINCTKHNPMADQFKHHLPNVRDNLIAVFCHGRGITDARLAYYSALGMVNFITPVETVLAIAQKLAPIMLPEDEKKFCETFVNRYGMVPSKTVHQLIQRLDSGDFDFGDTLETLKKLKRERDWPKGSVMAFSLAFARVNLRQLQYKEETETKRAERRRALLNHIKMVPDRAVMGIIKAKTYMEMGNLPLAQRTLTETRRSSWLDDPVTAFGVFSEQDVAELEQQIADRAAPKPLVINIEDDPALRYLRQLDHEKQKALQQLTLSQAENAELHSKLSQQERLSGTLNKQREHLQETLVNDMGVLQEKSREVQEQLQKVVTNYACLLVRRDVDQQIIEYLVSENIALRAELQRMRDRLQSIKPELYDDFSGIDPEGRGLKTRCSISFGTPIGDYSGEKAYRLWVPKLVQKYAAWTQDKDGVAKPLLDDTYVLWMPDTSLKTGRAVRHRVIPDKGIKATDCIFKFMNHSDKPNVAVSIVESDDKKSRKVVFITCRAIEAGEELTWNYDTSKKVDFTDKNKDMITDEDEFHKYMELSADGSGYQIKKPD